MSKETMTRNEVINFHRGLIGVASLKGAKFAYAVIKNKKACEKEIEIINEIAKQSEEFIAFERTRIELCKKHCSKNDLGEPKMIHIQGQLSKFEGLDDNENFVKEFKALQKENKKVIEEREKQQIDQVLFLKETTELEVHKMSITEIPEEITTAQLESIFPMIITD